MRLLSLLILISTSACATKGQGLREMQLSNLKTFYISDNLQLKERLSSVAKPHVQDNKVFVASAYDGVKALDVKSFRVLWSKNIEGGVESGFASHGSRLYFGGNDFNFYALNAESGIEIWKEKVDGEVLSQPVLDSGKLYFLTSNNTVYCLDAKEGKLLWRYRRSLKQDLTVRGASSPLLHNDRIYIGFSDGYFVSIRQVDGSLVWERQINSNPKFKDIDANAVIDGNQIFISGFDAKLYALNLTNGQILWSFDYGGVYAPVLVGSNLVYPDTNGNLFLLEKSSGKILRKWQTKNGIYRKPMIHNNYLIIGTSQGPIYLLDTITWKELASYHSGLGVASQAQMLGENEFLFVSEGNNLVKMHFAWVRPLKW